MFDAFVVALWLAANSSAVHAAAFDHVRSQELQIRNLIGEGYSRSSTFRELVDAVEDLPCIVYVATVVKLSQRMSGALLHQAVGARDLPILRVLVRASLSREEAIAIIGHELQHVVEAVSARRPVEGVDLAGAFDALDPTARVSGDRKYETAAAIAVTTKVREELQHARR